MKTMFRSTKLKRWLFKEQEIAKISRDEVRKIIKITKSGKRALD